jgi:hypothetical protein
MAPRRFRARARSAFPTEYGEDTGEEATDSERARARERRPFFCLPLSVFRARGN